METAIDRFNYQSSPYSCQEKTPSYGIDALTFLTTVIMILTLLLSIATVAIQVADIRFGDQMGMLSLRSVESPSNTPLFMVESTPNTRYMRGAQGVVYDGARWKLEKIQGESNDFSISSSTDDLPLCPTGLSETYGNYDRSVLNQALFIDDPQYLQLPDNISERVRGLSLEITENFETPFEKARAIEVFLKVGYTYNLEFTPAPSGWEPNDWFLFESREGICGNFTSAFVILARASGIPARLAAGYYVESGEGEQAVYENQAHAWGEVGFEELGWLAFDAT